MAGDPSSNRSRAECTICGLSHLAAVHKDRISPDPAIRAEAVGLDAEDWNEAPPRVHFDADCPDCDSETPHDLEVGIHYPGGLAVPTIHPQAAELGGYDPQSGSE